ncbi:hypothetical protein EDC01DRAFT_779325 [Geopyxis carbonaria]|nr:hypothetical protein EDC01DRAFT_779325 [Geopyxis carbonaria]
MDAPKHRTTLWKLPLPLQLPLPPSPPASPSHPPPPPPPHHDHDDHAREHGGRPQLSLWHNLLIMIVLTPLVSLATSLAINAVSGRKDLSGGTANAERIVHAIEELTRAVRGECACGIGAHGGG